MPQARKIFPFGIGSSPYETFKLVILSEGFVAGEERQFYDSCTELMDSILDTPPFNVLKFSPFWLNTYSHFEPSNNAGPAINTSASPGRSAFDSSLDTSAEILTLDVSKVATTLNTLTLKNDQTNVDLSELMGPGGLAKGSLGGLVVLLLPETSGNNGGELEYFPTDNLEYYFVATTMNGAWHQVILRSIGKLLGLGDEFELDGASFEAPPPLDHSSTGYPNLLYFDPAPTTAPNSSWIWYPMLSGFEQTQVLPVHPHPGTTGTPDRSLPSFPASPSSIELWEGGAGFRSKVYRPAFDCLMRRRLGDNSLPVRNENVPFCKVCKYVLFSQINSGF